MTFSSDRGDYSLLSLPNSQRHGKRRLTKLLLVMKLTMILLTITCLHAAARTQGQVTYSGKEVPLVKVFAAIEAQTDYKFAYNPGVLSGVKPITVNFQNISVEEALKQALKNQPLHFRIINRTVFLVEKPPASMEVNINDQVGKIGIRGRLYNKKNEPVAGATITVKGTNRITISNEKGEFVMEDVDEQAVLVVTNVNYEPQQVSIGGRREIILTLTEKIGTLQDVEVLVNTGYEKIPKVRSTGAFEIVNTEELNRRAGPDLLSRLEGVTTSIFFDRRAMAASQQTTGLSNIVIRGVSTLTSLPETVRQPLVVINGVPYDGDINNLNPNDVENISILKDAGAASIYGARAANGVIVITTRQGQLNQPMRVSLNTNTQVTSIPDLFELPQMSSSEFIDVETFLFNKGFYNADLNNKRFPALSPVVELLAKRRAGLISGADSAAAIDALRNSDVRRTFEDHIYQKAVSQQYFLNMSGGSDKAKYALGLGFDKTPSVLVGNETRRITVSLTNSFIPVKDLTIQLGVRYANAINQNNSLGEIGDQRYGYRTGEKSMLPYAQFFDANGNYARLAQDWRTGYIDTAGKGNLLDWSYNPLKELMLADNKLKTQDLVLNGSIAYKLTSDIQVSANYQYQHGNVNQQKNYSAETYYARNQINLYTNLNSTNVNTRNPIPRGGILDLYTTESTAQFVRGQVDFNRLIGTKHQINALAGGEVREMRFTTSSDRLYGYNDQRGSSSVVDLITRFPLYGNRGTASVPTGASGLTGRTDRFVSLFANAAYTYDNRYTVTVSGRRDAANLLGVEVNDKWSPFWSVGGAWNLSNERFFQVKWVSLLKLRSTYGFQGNVNNLLPPYTILSYEPASANSLSNLPFALIRTPANPGLSWEKIKQVNIGLDFSLFNSRVSGSIDVYRKRAEDLILSAYTDLTTGVGSVAKNSASMATKGVDLAIESWNIRSKFSWKSQFMMSYVKSKILETMLEDVTSPPALNVVGQSGLSISTREGFQPYSIYSYPFAGLDPATGDPMGYLGKGISKDYQAIMNQGIDTANILYHGSAIPTYFGNLNNTFSYKGISLTVSISYKFDYYFRKKTISYYSLYQKGTQHADYSKRWVKPGDEVNTHVPSMIYPLQQSRRDEFFAGSSVNVLKGDNIRLQYIRASYEIGRQVWKKMPFRSIQVYSVVENLGLLWKANDEGLDPDYNVGNSTYLPPLRITAGLKLDF